MTTYAYTKEEAQLLVHQIATAVSQAMVAEAPPDVQSWLVNTFYDFVDTVRDELFIPKDLSSFQAALHWHYCPNDLRDELARLSLRALIITMGQDCLEDLKVLLKLGLVSELVEPKVLGDLVESEPADLQGSTGVSETPQATTPSPESEVDYDGVPF